MKHVENLNKFSENLDVIVKGTVTREHVNDRDEVLYQIETPCGDCFEADEKCVYHDVTKPVEVPQFVADWYEKNKGSFDYNLWQYLTDWEEIEPSDFKNWINEECNIFQTLVNMHQFGYTVAKEKRYLVKMKGNIIDNILTYGNYVNEYFFAKAEEGEITKIYHTHKELEEAGFGEVFNSSLFEVEEMK